MQSAFDKLADSFGSGPGFFFNSHDKDGEPIVQGAADRVDTEVSSTGVRVPDTRVPSIFSQTFSGEDPLVSLFSFGPRKNWYEGEHVCTTRKIFDERPMDDEVADDPDSEVDMVRTGKGFFGFASTMRSCKNGPNFHECKTVTNDGRYKTTEVVRYECCYGYARTPGSDGCLELDMKPMKDTIEGLEAEEFEQLLEAADLMSVLDDNVTIFVPSNDAIEDFRHDLEQLNTISIAAEPDEVITYNVDEGLSYRRKRDALGTEKLAEILKGHMVEGFYSTNDVKDEDMIDTMGENNLRITVYNTYPEKVVMANCARVTSRDHFTTNGVAHIVDRVILPTTQTIADIVAEDVQLRTFNKIIGKSKMAEKLAESEGQFTVFAPTDEAFEKMDKVLRDKMLRGDGCGQDILNNHILPNVICSGVIDRKAKTINNLERYVVLDKDDDDRFFVNDIKVVTRDVMGTNGVIHIVEDVLIPESAQSISKALESESRVTFKELLDYAEVTKGLNELSNVTLFAPSEDSLSELDPEFVEELKNDKNKLRDFLMFHVVTPKKCMCELKDNMLLKSGAAGKKIRINAYPSTELGPFGIVGLSRMTYTAQCAKISRRETEICGGMIQTIDKPLVESADSVLDILEGFEKFKELIDFAEMTDEIATEDPVTIFAPTDEAFKKVDPEDLEKVFKDKNLAQNTVKGHIYNKFLCCAGIRRRNPLFNTSTKFMANEQAVVIRQSRGDRFYIEDAEITQCDQVADDGVVHSIDEVLMPKMNRVAESRQANLRRILDLIAGF